MASQRITIAKLAGLSGEIAWQRLSAWSSMRNVSDPYLWSPEQWPDQVRSDVDLFAERLREHGFALPMCHFVEWADMWSMGDLFSRWLTPPNSPPPIGMHANCFEVFAYRLPDDGRLANHLANAGAQEHSETNWFIAHLLEVVRAWEMLVPTATLVVLRNVIDGLVLDEEVRASLDKVPEWLSSSRSAGK